MQKISWIKKINAVLATIGTGDFNPVQDRQTYAVMSRAIRELMAAKTIADPLKCKVIQNIAIRVGPRDLAHDGDIALAKNHRAYARKNGWADFPTYEQRYGNAALEEAQVPVSLLDGFSAAESAIVTGFLERASDEQRAALVQWIEAQDEQAAPGPKLSIVPDAEPEAPSKPVYKRDALTLWVKESKGKLLTTGNLELGDHKFSLNFSDFYSALERIPQDANAASWRTFMAGEIADAVLPMEKNAQGVAARSTMSGLHAANDSRGYKPPVHTRAAVILEWDGSKPVAAMLYDGDETTVIEIKQETGERFKGAVEFAA